MAQRTQADRIHIFLRENPGRKFSAKELATEVYARFPEDYQEKRQNPRFSSDLNFINQIAAEIGRQTSMILKRDELIRVRDTPRPRVFWYEENPESFEIESEPAVEVEISDQKEADLYPLLMDYLQGFYRPCWQLL